ALGLRRAELRLLDLRPEVGRRAAAPPTAEQRRSAPSSAERLEREIGLIAASAVLISERHRRVVYVPARERDPRRDLAVSLVSGVNRAVGVDMHQRALVAKRGMPVDDAVPTANGVERRDGTILARLHLRSETHAEQQRRQYGQRPHR